MGVELLVVMEVVMLEGGPIVMLVEVVLLKEEMVMVELEAEVMV